MKKACVKTSHSVAPARLLQIRILPHIKMPILYVTPKVSPDTGSVQDGKSLNNIFQSMSLKQCGH